MGILQFKVYHIRSLTGFALDPGVEYFVLELLSLSSVVKKSMGCMTIFG
jgi:hypothetical protein